MSGALNVLVYNEMFLYVYVTTRFGAKHLLYSTLRIVPGKKFDIFATIGFS